MTGTKKQPAVPGHITWRKTGEEAVILNLETSEYYSANGAGTFVWELLNAGTKPGKIAESLADEYGITPAQAEQDISAFLKDLARLKIILPEALK